MTSIKITIDLRHLFGPVRDQGQRPTCLAFAASDLHAALRGPWSPLSCEYLFYRAQQRAKRTPTESATLPAMLAAIHQDGQPHESGWPYLAQLPADVAQWQPPAGVSPLFRRAGEAGGDTVDAIIAELDRGHPLLTLLSLSRSFYWVGPDGVVDQASGENPDEHVAGVELVEDAAKLDAIGLRAAGRPSLECAARMLAPLPPAAHRLIRASMTSNIRSSKRVAPGLSSSCLPEACDPIGRRGGNEARQSYEPKWATYAHNSANERLLAAE
jgi:hypothetical protein